MSHGRHSRRPALRRRLALAGLPLLAAGVVVGTGASVHGLMSGADLSRDSADLKAAAPSTRPATTPAATAPLTDLPERSKAVSRSAERRALAATPHAVRTMWTTENLDLRTLPREHTRTVGLLESAHRIGVTGHRSGGYAEVVVGGSARWVTAKYLSPTKVEEPGSRGLVDTPCAGTSGVESGLQPGAVRVYRAVCNNFPQIKQYGGYAARGEHASGKAIDIMTSDTALGNEIAAFLQKNAAALNLYDIIWQQHIWTPVRASEGWRSMSDRGSETANHFDHVHVSTN